MLRLVQEATEGVVNVADATGAKSLQAEQQLSTLLERAPHAPHNAFPMPFADAEADCPPQRHPYKQPTHLHSRWLALHSCIGRRQVPLLISSLRGMGAPDSETVSLVAYCTVPLEGCNYTVGLLNSKTCEGRLLRLCELRNLPKFCQRGS